MLDLDDKSKGTQVYWPSTQTVTVERNIYFEPSGASASQDGGEEEPFRRETLQENIGYTRSTCALASRLDGSWALKVGWKQAGQSPRSVQAPSSCTAHHTRG
jgi:hypothetical protein